MSEKPGSSASSSDLTASVSDEGENKSIVETQTIATTSDSSLPVSGETSAQTSSTRKRSETSADDDEPVRKSFQPGSSSDPKTSHKKNSEKIHVLIPIKVFKKQLQSYNCGFPNCHTGFNTAAELYKHSLDKHNKSFICRYCHCTYTSAKIRKKHEKEHVLCVTSTPDWEKQHDDVTGLTDIEQRNKNPIVCKSCIHRVNEFRSISLLRQHIATAHTLNAPNFCPCCQIWFEEDHKTMHRCES